MCAIRAHPTLQRGEFHHLIWVKDWPRPGGDRASNASCRSLAGQGIAPGRAVRPGMFWHQLPLEALTRAEKQTAKELGVDPKDIDQALQQSVEEM